MIGNYRKVSFRK